jgi:hypothetical protein
VADLNSPNLPKKRARSQDEYLELLSGTLKYLVPPTLPFLFFGGAKDQTQGLSGATFPVFLLLLKRQRHYYQMDSVPKFLPF